MSGNWFTEESTTKAGEASILIILLVSAIIVFIFLPITAVIIENKMVRIAIQEITDTIEISVFELYQTIDLDTFSQGEVVIKQDLKSAIEEKLTINHPQIEQLDIMAISHVKGVVTFTFRIRMLPTLYRQVLHLKEDYTFGYSILIPLDRNEVK